MCLIFFNFHFLPFLILFSPFVSFLSNLIRFLLFVSSTFIFFFRISSLFIRYFSSLFLCYCIFSFLFSFLSSTNFSVFSFASSFFFSFLFLIFSFLFIFLILHNIIHTNALLQNKYDTNEICYPRQSSHYPLPTRSNPSFITNSDPDPRKSNCKHKIFSNDLQLNPRHKSLTIEHNLRVKTRG